jgi:hypothetical protein
MCDEAKGCRLGTPKTGNFRGVCPFNRAKGVHRGIFRCNTELRWDLIFRNLSEPKKMAAGKSRIFQGNQETHGAVLW